MNEFIIKKISNGWILQGPRHLVKNAIACHVCHEDSIVTEDIFLPNMHAVAGIIEMWEMAGFAKASALADEKYNFVGR